MMVSSAIYSSPMSAVGGQANGNSLSSLHLPRSPDYQPLTPPTASYHSDTSSSRRNAGATSSNSSSNENVQKTIPMANVLNELAQKQHSLQKSPSAQVPKHDASKDIENVWNFPKCKGKSAMCYVCNRRVEETLFKQHLFFGPVKCKKCGLTCIDCLRFATVTNLVNTQCKHNFHFPRETYRQVIGLFTGNEALIKKGSYVPTGVTLEFGKYINLFSNLANVPPWSKAIQKCKKHIPVEALTPQSRHLTFEQIIERNYTNSKNEIESMNSPTPCKKTNKASKFSISHKYEEDTSDHILSQTYDLASLDQTTEYVQVATETVLESNTSVRKSMASNSRPKPVMPSDGNYLMLNKVIEECPMCYTAICPSRFLVNVISFLVTTVCIGCDLTIYFAVSPNVSIVTDESALNIGQTQPKKRKIKNNKRRQVKGSDFLAK